MPHINLLYPFLPRNDFERARAALQAALAPISAFRVTLAQLRWFHHGRQRYTLWLEPEPAQALGRLHEALWHAIPECDDLRRHPKGYTPHLSVGQVQGRDRMHALLNELQHQWKALSFDVGAVSAIERGERPDDVFHVVEVLTLGDDESA